MPTLTDVREKIFTTSKPGDSIKPPINEVGVILGNALLMQYKKPTAKDIENAWSWYYAGKAEAWGRKLIPTNG